MADLALTAAQIALVHPTKALVHDLIAAAAITKGQALYINTDVKVDLADANDAGKQQFRGIALNKAAAGQPVSVLMRGAVYGFTISGLNGDVSIYLSDTAGKLADAAGTMTVVVGRVFGTSEATPTKILFIDVPMSHIWS